MHYPAVFVFASASPVSELCPADPGPGPVTAALAPTPGTEHKAERTVLAILAGDSQFP